RPGLNGGRLGDGRGGVARRPPRGVGHRVGRPPGRGRRERPARCPAGWAGGRRPGPRAGERPRRSGPRVGERSRRPGRRAGERPRGSGPRARKRPWGASPGTGEHGRGQPGVTAGAQARGAVPGGLDGERRAAALARMLGLSRAVAADLISGGQVLVAGRPAVKSDRVPAGEWLDVTLPAPPAPTPVPQAVPGLAGVYEDADIVVVDKPAGVAAHPTPGWSGPTRLGRPLPPRPTLAPRRAPPPA